MNEAIGWLWATALGLCVGSFVNVIIHRLPAVALDPEASSWQALWQPRSHCPHCQHPLPATHLVPVLSWLLLRGRCGFCRHPIAWRYPVVEAATGALWWLCAAQWGLGIEGLLWAVFASALLALAWIDAQTTLLPDALTQPLLWLGLLASQQQWLGLPLSEAVAGAMLGYASLWLVATVFERITGKVGMGAGDFKLLAALGAWLGPLALLPLVLLASVLGAGVGLLLQRRGVLAHGGYLPFGPFLALGAGVMVLEGPALQRVLLGP